MKICHLCKHYQNGKILGGKIINIHHIKERRTYCEVKDMHVNMMSPSCSKFSLGERMWCYEENDFIKTEDCISRICMCDLGLMIKRRKK